MNNRYEFAKMCYPYYVILLLKNNRLYTYDINNKLYNFKNINKLRRLHINYCILDNLDIYKKEYSDNKYLEYYLKYNLDYILNNILDKLRKGD